MSDSLEISWWMAMVVGMEDLSNARASLTIVPILTGFNSPPLFRLKARICFVKSLARRQAIRISCRFCRAGFHSGTSSIASSELPRMIPRILLKSCAIPPARVPTDSILWACRSCVSSFSLSFSACFRAVIFSKATPRRSSGIGKTRVLKAPSSRSSL